MNKNQKLVLAGASVVLVLLFVYPPYAAIDRQSDGQLHAFIGYHWIWKPPSATNAYRQLMGSDPVGVDSKRLEAFEVQLNVVRLTENVLILAAVGALGIVLLRKRRKASSSMAN